MTEYLPKIGEKCYYMHREVVVIGVFDKRRQLRVPAA